jgi:uroporphyrinogen III methyltransferase/synthase
MRTLEGRRILITRPQDQAGELSRRLSAEGAIPVIFPTIRIAPPLDYEPLERAIHDLRRFDWVIFTSANGVDAFWERLSAAGLDASALAGVKVASIGPATRASLAKRGVQASFTPPRYVAEEIAAGIGDVRGRAILLPRAHIARPALAQELRRKGATVTEVVAYRTLTAEPAPEALVELERGLDAVVFTSSSTVTGLFEILGPRAQNILKDAVIACIGPITAQTARERNLRVSITAQEYTSTGLVRALIDYYRSQKEGSL